MSRSLIARVIFLIAIAVSSLARSQSVRAEMPLEAWLAVAVDSLDQQIGRQRELPWETLGRLGKRTKESFDRMLDQCRMGVAGPRGLQLVRAIDLLLEIRDLGVAGTLCPAKNWNFPLENYELQSCRPLQPMVEAVDQAWEQRHATSTGQIRDQNRARIAISHSEPDTENSISVTSDTFRNSHELRSVAGFARVQLTPRKTEVWRLRPQLNRESILGQFLKAPSIKRYWLEVSNFAQAKLNWLTSKARHIAEAYLESIEPQFLILELDPLA